MNKILCVDIKSMNRSEEIQTNLELEELLLNHTKYFSSIESAYAQNYAPISFCVSVRSMYSNLVLQIDKGNEFRYYTNLTNVMDFPHTGYDLVMYLASVGLMQNIDYKTGFDYLMMNHSQFSPIGLYNPNPYVVRPIVYSHIIMSDEGAEKLKEFLKSDRELVSIDVMREHSEGNIKALLNTIIEVREENKNE